jgi:hypothetical protein
MKCMFCDGPVFRFETKDDLTHALFECGTVLNRSDDWNQSSKCVRAERDRMDAVREIARAALAEHGGQS